MITHAVWSGMNRLVRDEPDLVIRSDARVVG
jgi:hypothetical protein